MDKKYYFLSGLPRSGTTLLRAILDQNPNVYSEGYSGLCQVMNANYNILNNNAYFTLRMTNKNYVSDDILSEIPKIFYRNTEKNIILDNHKLWTTHQSDHIIKRYMISEPKIVVTLRPMEQILKSYVKILQMNGRYEESEVKNLLIEDTDPIMVAYKGLIEAMHNDTGQYLFLSYDSLVDDTENTIKRIYEFFEWDYFQHDLNNIIQENMVDDNFVGLVGLHDIRSSISRRVVDVEIDQDILNYCKVLTNRYKDLL